MQTSKIHVAIICGGQSPEHEISLMSTQNVLNALNQEKFEPIVIYISKSGTWHYVNIQYHKNLSELLSLVNELPKICFTPSTTEEKKYILFHPDNKNIHENTNIFVDIAFPVLHGQLGEDGAIQGLFKILNLPFVGNDILSSALCMDKEITKRLLQHADINVPLFQVFHAHEKSAIDFHHITNTLGLPFFIKPANTGSSVGIAKIKNKETFDKILTEIFRYDDKILVEQYIPGRELECAVIGNENPIASLPGEIICHREFYSYEAKYLDPDGADVKVPADLSSDEIKTIQEMSVKAYKTLCCSGLARIDFFYSNTDKKIYLNELNTMPGFTNISMYPKCFEATGIIYSSLIEKLILLGMEKKRIFGL